MQKLLSRVDFFSLYSYCPRGEAVKIKESQLHVMKLKHDKLDAASSEAPSLLVAKRVQKEYSGGFLKGLFEEDVVCVPAPRSHMPIRDGLWVPHRIASAISALGMARGCFACLKRTKSVPKAAYSPPAARPTVQDHHSSLQVDSDVLLGKPTVILLVDDVVTTGATLLAGISRLKEVFTEATVLGFAAVRTISNPDEFSAFLEPRIGTIELRGKQTFRNP